MQMNWPRFFYRSFLYNMKYKDDEQKFFDLGVALVLIAAILIIILGTIVGGWKLGVAVTSFYLFVFGVFLIKAATSK